MQPSEADDGSHQDMVGDEEEELNTSTVKKKKFGHRLKNLKLGEKIQKQKEKAKQKIDKIKDEREMKKEQKKLEQYLNETET